MDVGDLELVNRIVRESEERQAVMRDALRGEIVSNENVGFLRGEIAGLSARLDGFITTVPAAPLVIEGEGETSEDAAAIAAAALTVAAAAAEVAEAAVTEETLDDGGTDDDAPKEPPTPEADTEPKRKEGFFTRKWFG